MTSNVKKSAARLLRALYFCMFCLAVLPFGQAFAALRLPQPAPPQMPYAISTAFYRAGPDAVSLLPGTLPPAAVFLAVTATPREAGGGLYASKSQTGGKVTEISVVAEGTPIPSPVLFPRGAPKPDPLNPGGTARMFPDAFTALVPLPDSALAAEYLNVRLTGLACSAVNCTPLVLSERVAVPDEQLRKDLPDAALAPWWDALLLGVVEAMPPVASSGNAESVRLMPLSPLSLPAAPLASGVGKDGVFPAGDSSTFIEKITPVPFSPGLEVSSLGKAVVLGFLAGIILNLMPCVLPVLGIKLAALMGHGGHTPEGMRNFRRHQVFFAGGILAWFTVMAGLFHFLDLAWGQIFQSPVVVFALAMVLLFLALNMFGVCSLPLIDLRAGNAKNPALRAFGEGFGATLLATPCGGPLLGGVLSWALLQPLGVLAVTLECVGLGMASPYLLLAAFPSLAKRFPRPGEWMRTMEQVLGFLLLGTVAYLVSFLPSDGMPRVVGALVLAAFGGWLWQKKAAARLLGIACIMAACVWPLYTRPPASYWMEYTHTGLRAVLGKQPVLVDFTADWCPTCKVVEATALRDATLAEWKKEHNLALFRVDLTRENPEGEALLRAVGSVSIPVIAVFGTGDSAYSPLVLRDVVTKGQIEAALEQAVTKE